VSGRFTDTDSLDAQSFGFICLNNFRELPSSLVEGDTSHEFSWTTLEWSFSVYWSLAMKINGNYAHCVLQSHLRYIE
jgi:hypothetical protein